MNKNDPAYPLYGGRGIKVDPEWAVSFEAFLSSVGPRPSGRTLDRIDNDGDYEPRNVRWATAQQQQRNRRTNMRVEYNGETMALVELSERIGMPYPTLRHRIKKGWDIGRAVTQPVKHRGLAAEAGKE